MLTKRYIIKYLIIVIIIGLVRLLLHIFLPELFTETIEGDGFTQTSTTFIGIYQTNLSNVLLGIFILIDLYRIKTNWIIIPLLTIISGTAGLFFFGLIILLTLMTKNEEV